MSAGYQGDNIVICTSGSTTAGYEGLPVTVGNTYEVPWEPAPSPETDVKPAGPEVCEQPMPEWICVASDIAAKLFGVTHYAIFVRLVSGEELREQSPNDIDEDDDVGGNTDPNPRYLFSKVGLNADIEQDEDGFETIAHEFFHIAQAQLLLNAERMIELCDLETQDHARALFQDGNEQAATLIGRIVGPILQRRTQKKLLKRAKAELQEAGKQLTTNVA